MFHSRVNLKGKLLLIILHISIKNMTLIPLLYIWYLWRLPYVQFGYNSAVTIVKHDRRLPTTVENNCSHRMQNLAELQYKYARLL